LELAIPGFRGYRKREDLRIADSLLRKQLADDLGDVKGKIELCRKDLAAKMEMDLLNNVGALMNNITSTENRVRHAEQGYSGVSADYNIREDELDTMYEWDLHLISDIQKLSDAVSVLQSTIKSGDTGAIGKRIEDVEEDIREFNSLFDRRIETIVKLGV
jgi:predicted  nucleic acid-binding Zn-ribbon protein